MSLQSGEVRVLLVPGDYLASRRFWTETVGLAVHEEFDDGGGVLLTLGPGVLLELLAEGDGPRPPGLRIGMRVDDVVAEHGRLAAAGCAVTDPLLQPWGHWNTTLSAPDGVELTLFEVVGDESGGGGHG
jgi:hypothetical protein